MTNRHAQVLRKRAVEEFAPGNFTETACRDYARGYIRKRFKEGDQADVIEELSVYVGCWVYMEKQAKKFWEEEQKRT